MKLVITILFSVFLINCNAQFSGISSARIQQILSNANVVDSAYYNMSRLPITITVSGLSITNVNGNPVDSVFTRTSPNGWSISTVATTNWSADGSGNSAVDNVNVTNSYFTELPSTAMRNFHYSISGAYYSPGNYQYLVSNLPVGAVFEVSISGARGASGFDANPISYRVTGTSTSAEQQINGSVATQTTGAKFTVTVPVSGQLGINANPVVGQSAQQCTAIIKLKRIS